MSNVVKFTNEIITRINMGLPLAIGAGLISAGGSLLGNLLGFGSQAATNKAQMELAKYQYEKNLEMWNRQNEYNLPSAQRQRLIDAGLNPALMYGSGHISNVAADAPSYDAPHLSAYTNFGDFGASGAINAYLSASKNVAEVDNIEEDTNVKKWNQQLVQMQRYQIINDIAETQLRIARTQIEKKYWEGLAKSSYEKLKQEVDNLELQGDYIKAEARERNASAELTEENAETVRQSRPQIIKNLAAQGDLLNKQALAAVAAANASNASANASNATARNQLAQAQKAQVETKKALEELARFQHRRPEQLEAFVNQKVYESYLAGEKVTEQIFKNWLIQYNVETGINPTETGMSGLINKAAHSLNALINGFPEYKPAHTRIRKKK